MTEILDSARAIISTLDLRSVLDILVVAALAYGLLSLIRGTTAVPLLRGIAVVLLVGSLASGVLGLSVLGWLLRNSFPALLVAVPILFQPEIRRALEQVGRGRGLIPWPYPITPTDPTIEAVAVAARLCADRGWGALIVLERQIPLGEYAQSGIQIDAEVSTELLLSIFLPPGPLHDGAVLVRGDRLLAARCILPLPETVDAQPDRGKVDGSTTYRELGLRHRAGIGITEKTDAVSILVSEGTRRISLCSSGRMFPDLDEVGLRRLLGALYRSRAPDVVPALLRMRVPHRQS